VKRDRQDKNSFNHNPFKPLKGLPVSGEAKPRPTTPPPLPSPPGEADDSDLFAREMTALNVRPVAGDSPGPPAESRPAEEDGLSDFLAAVGTLDKTFRDDPPEGEEPPRARPRRMKQLERGELKPAGELDLHGLTRDEAVARARTFLAQAVRQKWPVVIIVTGKGLHSAEGPVLRRAVERLLDTSRDLVLEWGAAPRRYGGAGALVAFLKISN
jgi:DNA-nicking Smr family endonuclease